MSVVLFGFLAAYLAGAARDGVAYSLITGMLLWQVVFIVQYSVALNSLWNIWSRNLSNVFITPLTITEYLLAQSLSGILKAFLVFIPAAIFSQFIFHFNMGIIVLGLIFRFGTRIQSFAWGLLPIIQPLSAAFYPVSVLPGFLKPIAYMFPTTYIFEALRAGLGNPPTTAWALVGVAFMVNSIYFLGALGFFRYMFRQSKITGEFAKLEG
jgi:ABC-2 type transport system permease protein